MNSQINDDSTNQDNRLEVWNSILKLCMTHFVENGYSQTFFLIYIVVVSDLVPHKYFLFKSKNV